MRRRHFIGGLMASLAAPASVALSEDHRWEALIEKVMSRADQLWSISYQSSGQMIRKTRQPGCSVSLNFEWTDLGKEFVTIVEAKDLPALLAFSNRPEFADE